MRTLVEASWAGDTEAALGCYAEDGEHRVLGNTLVSGSYRGRAAILSHQVELIELGGGTTRATRRCSGT